MAGNQPDTVSAERAEALKHAAGAHSKTPHALKKAKTFMSVPECKHGYLDMHEHDEGEMEDAFKGALASPITMAKRMAGFDLEGPWEPGTQDVCGKYNVSAYSGYCVSSFTVEEKDVVLGDEMRQHLVGCCGAPAHALGVGKVVMHLLLRKTMSVFCFSPLAWLIRFLAGTVVYTFTVSENGIVRFHLPPETGTFTKICFAYADSESFLGFFKNIQHAMSHGCFCLGVFYKEKQATPDPKNPPRLVIMRFNRWKEGLAPYWVAVQEAGVAIK